MHSIVSQFSCEIGNVSLPPAPLPPPLTRSLSLSLTFFFFFLFLHIDQRGTALIVCHTLQIDRLHCGRVRGLGHYLCGSALLLSSAQIATFLSIQAVT